MRISEQGPQGPVSPMDQKLSFSPRRTMRSAATPADGPPELEGLIVVLVDRDPELLFRELYHRGQEFPGKLDGLFLEVIAEGEVARASRRRCGAGPCGPRFRGRCACRRRARTSGWSPRACSPASSSPRNTSLELHHARVREQQRGVVPGNEGRARHDLVALCCKIVQEQFP